MFSFIPVGLNPKPLSEALCMMKWPADRRPGDFQSDALFYPFLSPTNRGWQCWRIKRGKPDQGLAYVVNGSEEHLSEQCRVFSERERVPGN